MHEREQSVSTFMGNGLAIPHGTNESKDAIKGSAISFIRYEKPVDWGGQPTYFVVGIGWCRWIPPEGTVQDRQDLRPQRIR